MAAKGGLHLHHVSPELLETIIQYLSLDAIKSLRLTSKEFAARCLGPRFRSFVRQQRTDLTARSLQSLCSLASHPKLGPAVRNLTIVATLYDTLEVEEILSRKTRPVTNTDRGALIIVSFAHCSEEELSTARSDLA